VVGLILSSLFLLSFALVGLYRGVAVRRGVLDHPNARSSHSVAVPRGGGLVVIGLWLLFSWGYAVFYHAAIRHVLILSFGPLGMAVIGFLDDLLSVRASYRVLSQFILAGLTLLFFGGVSAFNFGEIQLHWLVINSVICLLLMVWSTNLFNFMDGTDGLAAVEGIFVFGVGGVLLWWSHAWHFAILLWALVSIILGFLVWNWPRAKLFMGDVGSASLGFLVVIVAVASAKWYHVPLLIWMILYAYFMVDATLTLIRRVLSGEPWYQAHRSHAYQRLHQAGWSHRSILFASILLNGLLAFLAIMAYWYENELLIFAVLAYGLCLVAYIFVEKVNPMFRKNALT